MAAKNVGVKLGRGVGIVGATLWKGTVLAANGLGELGEGFAEGVESGWEDRCAAMDLADAQRKALRLAKAQEMALALQAKLEAEQTAPASPIKAKRTAAA